MELKTVEGEVEGAGHCLQVAFRRTLLRTGRIRRRLLLLLLLLLGLGLVLLRTAFLGLFLRRPILRGLFLLVSTVRKKGNKLMNN